MKTEQWILMAAAISFVVAMLGFLVLVALDAFDDDTVFEDEDLDLGP